jgi:Uma2 family endonuclease
MSVLDTSPPKASGPAWEIARLFPDQGSWTEHDYLSLTENIKSLVELVDGCIEVLPMPKASHQNIVVYLLTMLRAFVSTHKLGYVLPAPFRIHLGENTFREPDISFMAKGHTDRMSDEFWEGADLVMEVVSDTPKDRERDLETKRVEYAQARISEYWIIDRLQARIKVLKLVGDSYVVHAEASVGQRASSALLPGFELDAAAVFDAATLKL